MFKLTVLLNKKPDATPEEFAKYWLEVHAALARKMPGLRKYVINVVRAPPNRPPDYDGVVELWFDDKDDMKKAFASPEGEATDKDLQQFTTKTTTLFTDEHPIV